jgi:uncharacterized phiE125 gp8 family phage protein
MDFTRRITEMTQPAVEPITLDQLKLQLRITSTTEDTWLTDAIVAARCAAESYSGYTFIQRNFKQSMDTMSGLDAYGLLPIAVTVAMLEVRQRPLVSVSAITLYDDADVATIVPGAAYFVDVSDVLLPGRIAPRAGVAWAVFSRVANGMTIDFTAGASATAGGLPGDIRAAVLKIAAHMYSNRGDCDCDASSVMNPVHSSGAAGLLDKYRLARF